MYETPDRVRKSKTVTMKPKEPKEVRITLHVCACYSYEKVTFVTLKA
jgi:hypothetical protein